MVKLKQVNLIPQEVLKKPFHRQLKILFRKEGSNLRLFIILALSISLFSLSQLSTASRLERNATQFKQMVQGAKIKLNQAESQYLELEKTKSDLSKVEAIKKEKLDLFLLASSGDRRYSRLLAFISNLIPEELWITHLVLNDAEIQIYGSTTNNQLISEFMGKLDDSHVFRNSHFASSEKQVVESHTLYNFQMTTEPIWSSPQLQKIKDKDTGKNVIPMQVSQVGPLNK